MLHWLLQFTSTVAGDSINNVCVITYSNALIKMVQCTKYVDVGTVSRSSDSLSPELRRRMRSLTEEQSDNANTDADNTNKRLTLLP